MRRLVESSVGRFVFDIPQRGRRPASYVLFDENGKEIDHATWFPRSDIAGMLVNVANVPEYEAQKIERQLIAELQAERA